jgi:HD-like signal output (HDOD) protein
MVNKEISRLLDNVAELSTLPEVTQRILSVTEDPDSSARDLNEILKHDLALSAKLLRVVNSAFYGLPGRIADLDRAIVLLGFQAVRNLAVAGTMASLFRNQAGEVRGFQAKELWRHSVATGVAARSIVNVIGLRSLREEAFLAGIIHDFGVVVEYQFAEQQFAQVMRLVIESKATLADAERSLWGVSHQEIGQNLAERWKFPRNMQFVAGYHHRPMQLAEELRLLPTVVALAEELVLAGGFKFLEFGRESERLDWASLSQSVNLGGQDETAIREGLPAMVAQASSWLDL